MQNFSSTTVIAQTKKWITDVVIECGFCPFAANEIKRNSVHYEILLNATMASGLKAVANALYKLDANAAIETSLLILPGSFSSLDQYLQLVETTEKFIIKENYEGVYQVASFHPKYLFAGSNETDPANYTNRSPYPMLHFLREKSVSKAVDAHADIDGIPIRNTKFANEKGLVYMKELLAACLKIDE